MFKSKLYSQLRARMMSSRKDTNRNLDKNRVKVEIESICTQYLDKSGQVLYFEVKVEDLDHVISLIESDSITKYDLFQSDRTVFGAQLKEVELI